MRLYLDAVLHIQSSHLRGRRYITFIAVEPPEANCEQLKLDSRLEWRHLVVTLDVGGCRSIELGCEVGVVTAPAGAWLRFIPREMLRDRGTRFDCDVVGGHLRDITPLGNPCAPLFALGPPPDDLVWYREETHGPSCEARMIRRTVPQANSAITIAFIGACSVDVFFHGGDPLEEVRFYASLQRFRPTPTLRYFQMQPDEIVAAVDVRKRTDPIGGSRTCIMVCTSPHV